jgi:hypothetical protein
MLRESRPAGIIGLPGNTARETILDVFWPRWDPLKMNSNLGGHASERRDSRSRGQEVNRISPSVAKDFSS